MTKSDLSPYFFYSAKNNINNLLQNLIDTSSIIENYIDKKKITKIIKNPEELSYEDMTDSKFNLIDAWIKKHN